NELQGAGVPFFIKYMITIPRIEEIIKEYVADSEIFLVDIHISPGNSIVIRIDSPEGVTIGACAQLSRHVESFFDREEEDFSLEVASAGLGQPFCVSQQYHKIVGKQIEIVLKDGRKIVESLIEVNADGVVVSQSAPKISNKMLKALPPEERERIKLEQSKNISVAWDEIKSATEHINFQ
ncbi:MAG: ribosome assembly cofactor RimP, partial [Salinivirgaceae bacterium]|nr:ribosome assembly cofactor RimP [Salinivirgaceae bacterium]